MIETERDYVLRREKEEREASHAATDSSVRDTHLIMAERYADRAAMLEEQHFPDSASETLKLRYVKAT